MAISVEKLTESDLSELINLRRLSLLAIAPNHYNAQEIENLIADYDVAQIADMIANDGLFCCRQDNKLIGTSGWGTSGRFGESLCHVYVAPEHFAQGLGSQLVHHTYDDFKSRTNHPMMKADVVTYAGKFFEKCGFELLSKQQAWDGSAYYKMARTCT